MRIGERRIGAGHPVFIIAEIGSNHAGDLDLARRLIDAAADAGADAAKFQYFRVDRFLVPRPDPEALRKYELPEEWLPQLKARCTERGIEFLCTAFDDKSFETVDPFVNAYKVGSYEASRYFFTWSVKRHDKPVLISNGITRATYHDDFYTAGIVTLQCVNKYPADIDAYLRMCPEMFMGAAWGVSDHTLDPLTVPCAAVALGAYVVEKHMGGMRERDFEPHTVHGAPAVWQDKDSPDESVSISPRDFAAMVAAIRKTERAIR